MPVVAVPVELAPLFAEAHERVHRSRALAHDGSGTVSLPTPGREDGWTDASPAVLHATAALDAVAPASPIVVVAGPGVVRDGAVAGLHAFATAASAGVLNTWGAKGIFDWRSPHHLATAGLQAYDFELGGLEAAGLVVTTGLDPGECRGLADAVRSLAVLDVAPGMLGVLAARWRARVGVPIDVPPLRSRLAEVTQRGWAVDAAPLPPTRITRTYASVLGASGLVAADPGTTGFWVARTFATSTLGAVHVPAHRDRAGFAVACVAVARLRQPLRPAMAVVDDPTEPRVVAALEAARALGAPVAVEAWPASGGDALDAAVHEARLRELATSATSRVVAIAPDASQLDEMVAAAGPIVAWT